MSRAERRREERKNKKLLRWITHLTRDQQELLEQYCTMSSKADIEALANAYERVLRPVLYDAYNEDIISSEIILRRIIEQVNLEGVAISKFEDGSIGYMKKINDERENIIKEYDALKQQGMSEKAILEDIVDDFPKLTASSIRSVILEHKRDIKKAQFKEMSTEEAVDYIFDKEPQKEENKDISEQNNQCSAITPTEEKKEIAEPGNKSKFKILKSVVDVEGEYGAYHIENGCVQCKDLVFKTEKDIKAVFDERRK